LKLSVFESAIDVISGPSKTPAWTLQQMTRASPTIKLGGFTRLFL